MMMMMMMMMMMNISFLLIEITSKEHRTSSTVGQIIIAFPRPKGLSSDSPDDIEVANSFIHFSSKEPSDENCRKTF